MGYHLKDIPKGILGELSKIEEETAELADALAQGNKLMALQEMSDMYGAIEAMLSRRFPLMRMSDLAIMARATRSAFLDGTRPTPVPQLTFSALRAQHTSIHFFGLGFIQIKLGMFMRVHVYHPDLPSFVDEPHDHRYDFHSTVLMGSLTNTFYEFACTEENMSSHHMIETSCTSEHIENPFRSPVQLVGMRVVETKEGDAYTLGRDEFHTVTTSPLCITVLRRSLPVKAYARVVRENNAISVCPFSKNLPEETLWKYVEHAWQSL